MKAYYQDGAENINERDIISADGERLRPDRLNFSGKMVSIIDYKTGGFTDTHENQLKKYEAILTDMGFTVQEKLLVYTHSPVIIKKV